MARVRAKSCNCASSSANLIQAGAFAASYCPRGKHYVNENVLNELPRDTSRRVYEHGQIRATISNTVSLYSSPANEK